MIQILQHKWLKLVIGIALIAMSVWQFTEDNIENGKITGYRVNVKITFEVE